ncbi:MAG: arsinothricin resistance N-acetyltransferase ArsN1 family B [Acidimicrobiia bacterium]
MPRIRPVTPDDAARIAAIYEPVVRDTAVSFELEPPSPEEMGRRIETVTPGHPWLVSEEEGNVVAYAYATAFRQRPAYRWSAETTVYVDGDHQGQGVGRHLYGALIEVATLWGFANAYAGIALPNPASESLHASIGFTPVGVFPRAGHKFGRWHDVGWWHRPLSPTEPPRSPTTPPAHQVQALLSNR